MTIVVQVSNSDNKLTQSEWSEFVVAIRELFERYTEKVFFEGGSQWDASQQAACWVAEVSNESRTVLLQQLKLIRQKYKQDSVAVTLGETTFV